VLNDILKQGELSGTQKQRIIILVPKSPHPSSTAEFRPITLLTTDYKILTKKLANTLKLSHKTSTRVTKGMHTGMNNT
jgi:hypothetical protein